MLLIKVVEAESVGNTSCDFVCESVKDLSQKKRRRRCLSAMSTLPKMLREEGLLVAREVAGDQWLPSEWCRNSPHTAPHVVLGSRTDA